MKIRSVGLAVFGTALLVASAALGGLLVYDGETSRQTLAHAQPGDSVEVKGNPQPFHLDAPLARWATVLPALANYTYEVEVGHDVVALLTSEQPLPDGTVLAQGTVTYVGPHPQGGERMLAVISVQEWRHPLLFR